MKQLYLGRVLTMAQPQYAEAVLVEDGVIRAVGSAAELRKLGGDWEEIPFQGTLMPGFVDPHSHYSQMAYACLQASLNDVRSAQEIQQRIKAFLQETKPAPGTWIQARDYDHNLLPGGKNITLEQLDALTPGYPLVIHHKSGHMGLMNSQAMETLGITPDTPCTGRGQD